MNRRHVILGATALVAGAKRRAVAQETKLAVVASFSILADLVREVGGSHVDVRSLVAPDQDAHGFQPSPAEARMLAAARVVVVNGLGFEGWLDRLVKASGFKGRRIVATEGVKTLRAARGGHGHGHAHGHSHGHAHGGADPHVWQDPMRVQTMVRTIARGLAAAAPAHADDFARNADAYAARLRSLDEEISTAIAAVPKERRKVVTSHDAFAYFEDRYGVDFKAPRGVNAESEPSAADVARLIREIRREKVKVVFYENITDPRSIEQLAREGGAQLGGRIYSDALSAAGGPAATYLDMMRYNASRLRDAMLAE